MHKNLSDAKRGFRDAIPIFLGYLAVSFTFGILAKKTGLTVFQSTLMSATNLTSAGQFAGLTLISAGAAYGETALTQLIINSRYLLMSASLSQKLDPETPLYQRALMAFGISDEIFGISVAQKHLTPFYTLGAMANSVFGWTLGTFLGGISGGLLPANVIDALSLALYGMLITVIVPPALENKILLRIIAVSMAVSGVTALLPSTRDLSPGLKIILLTLILTGLAAKFFPREVSHEQ